MSSSVSSAAGRARRWQSPALAAVMLCVLVVAGTATNPVAAQAFVDHHVVFDNSASKAGHHHSETHLVGPSSLRTESGRIPVDTARFASAPNSLRLEWRSVPGGEWRATVRIPARYARKFRYEGDALVLQVFASDSITAANTLRISLRDDTGFTSPTIDLIRGRDTLAAGRWTEIVIPFSEFRLPFQGTDDRRFQPELLAAVNLMQGLDDGKPHTLWIDDILVRPSSSADREAPAPATDLRVAAGESHFDLVWNRSTSADTLTYRIERADDGRNFIPIATRPATDNRLVDFPGVEVKLPAYRVTALDLHGNASAGDSATRASTARRRFNDDELLDLIQFGCFRYYWENAHPEAGLAPEILPGDPELLATGGNGFGFIALTVAAQRGYVPREAAAERMLRAVRFLARADRFHGAWPHFLDPRGKAIAYFGPYDNGGDLVETAFVVQGLLVARQFFDRDTPIEREIRETCTRLWREVEWDWYRKTPDSDVLYWHWSPDHAFHISHPLIGWNETFIVYLLAIASPTHPVPASLYHTGWAGTSPRHIAYRQAWSRTTDGDHYVNGRSYFGIRLDVGEGNGAYGFHDGFNAAQDWYDEGYMALNQAPITVMIENHRTASPWRNFMANPEIQPALDAIGFKPAPRGAR